MKVGEQLCSPNKHHAFDEIMTNVNVSEMTESCMKLNEHESKTDPIYFIHPHFRIYFGFKVGSVFCLIPYNSLGD